MPRRKPPAIPDGVLDRLLAGSDPRAALADGGPLGGLKKAGLAPGGLDTAARPVLSHADAAPQKVLSSRPV